MKRINTPVNICEKDLTLVPSCFICIMYSLRLPNLQSCRTCFERASWHVIPPPFFFVSSLPETTDAMPTAIYCEHRPPRQTRESAQSFSLRQEAPNVSIISVLQREQWTLGARMRNDAYPGSALPSYTAAEEESNHPRCCISQRCRPTRRSSRFQTCRKRLDGPLVPLNFSPGCGTLLE